MVNLLSSLFLCHYLCIYLFSSESKISPRFKYKYHYSYLISCVEILRHGACSGADLMWPNKNLTGGGNKVGEMVCLMCCV